MGQKQEELLKRIQKLVKQNKELFNSNEKLHKAISRLSERNEAMKLRLKDTKEEVTDGVPADAEERVEKYNMATVLFAYIGGFKHLTDVADSEVVMDQLDEVLIEFDRILKKYQIHKIKTIAWMRRSAPAPWFHPVPQCRSRPRTRSGP